MPFDSVDFCSQLVASTCQMVYLGRPNILFKLITNVSTISSLSSSLLLLFVVHFIFLSPVYKIMNMSYCDFQLYCQTDRKFIVKQIPCLKFSTVHFQDNSGFLDFREYLIGLALVSQPANTDKVMQVAFQVSCCIQGPVSQKTFQGAFRVTKFSLHPHSRELRLAY